MLSDFSATNFGNYSFILQNLDLSHNQISVLAIDLLSAIPGLNVLDASYNLIQAVPIISNHIDMPDNMALNVLNCSAYGPTATGCVCSNPRLTANVFCGYVRCTPSGNGCPADSEFNSSDCSGAPWSSCVPLHDVPPGQYYDTVQESFRPLTVCDNEFMDATVDPPRPLQAYEYSAPTRTSNRQVSGLQLRELSTLLTLFVPTVLNLLKVSFWISRVTMHNHKQHQMC